MRQGVMLKADGDINITYNYNAPIENKPESSSSLGDFLCRLFLVPQKLKQTTNLCRARFPQIGLVVMRGESGAGKTSLLRAGLSHLLKDKDCRYVYWEARPTEAVAGLLKSIQQVVGGANSQQAIVVPPMSNGAR